MQYFLTLKFKLALIYRAFIQRKKAGAAAYGVPLRPMQKIIGLI